MDVGEYRRVHRLPVDNLMRKALIVGIDEYASISRLYGCVNDANQMRNVLARHSDGSPNFDCLVVAGSDASQPVRRSNLRAAIEELFAGKNDVSLLYFSGHGYIESTGGYLCAGDTEDGNDGIPLSEIMTFANRSESGHRIVILDSCHSGIAGTHPILGTASEIHEGVTILSASTAEQYATEENGAGIFTTLLVDALNGAAANLIGDVTPGAVYAHVDQSLGPWGQRPVFKTNVDRFVSLRTAEAPVPLSELRQISNLFPAPGFHFQLDPTFEPERAIEYKSVDAAVPPPNPENTRTFATLQKYNRVGLLVPEGAPHMWHAAMESKTVRLTALGEYYRALAERGRI